MDERDLPEGVIDAEPAGGWQDEAHADAETERSNAVADGETDYAGSRVGREDADRRGDHEEER